MLSRAARLTALTTDKITGLIRDRRKVVAIAGAAAALAGTGAGVATTLGGPAPASHTAASHTAARTTTPVTRTTAARTTPARAAVRTSPARDTTRVEHAVTSREATRRAPAPAAAAAAKPYLMYDSTTPASIPAHHQIATYANGSYAVPHNQVNGRRVMWIDTNGSDPRAAALDVEPGDATPAIAANWARIKLTEQPNSLAHIYTMLSDWPAVKADVAGLPQHMQSHVRYWIADPTGTPHLVPGSQATQWYWGHNYDISTVAPNFQ
jgi:hypothetical protein